MRDDEFVAGFQVNPPDDELPAVLGVRAVLGRTHDVIVGVVGGDLYSSGFSLRLAVRCRVPLFPPERLNHVAAFLAEDSGEQAEHGLDLSIHYRPAPIRLNGSTLERRAGFRHVMSSGRNLATDIQLWVSSCQGKRIQVLRWHPVDQADPGSSTTLPRSRPRRSQARTASAPRGMDTLRNLAITILRRACHGSSAGVLRQHGRRPDRPLQTIVNC